MLPGDESTASLLIVCIESMTSNSGLMFFICVKIVSSDVSQTIWQLPRSWVMRSARNFICCTLSSPDTYRTLRWGNPRIVCNTSVDFPIPGSPPSNTNEPGTRPPPSTRFSSLSHMSIRGNSSVATSSMSTGSDCVLSPLDTFDKGVLRTTFSVKLFHAPHEGHLPAHFGDS